MTSQPDAFVLRVKNTQGGDDEVRQSCGGDDDELLPAAVARCRNQLAKSGDIMLEEKYLGHGD